MDQVAVEFGEYNKKLEDTVILHLGFQLILQRYRLHVVAIADIIFTSKKFGWNV